MTASLDTLRTQALTGGPSAVTALGLALLQSGSPQRDAAEGFSKLEQAARAGDGRALAQLSVFAAGGVNREPSWEAALDALVASASAGWAPAQREVQFLAGTVREDWGALREEIILNGWFEPPDVSVVSESPRIGLVRGFLPPVACDWFINRAKGALTPASIYNDGKNGARLSKERTNSEFAFDLFNADIASCALQARIEAAFDAPAVNFETLTLMHYAPGQQFTPHHDFLNPAVPGMAENIRAQGQRVLTVLVYLNDDYQGGETEFPNAGFVHKARRGDALVFANVDQSGAPDPKTLHAGRAPTRGEKWILSQWVRDRPQGW